MQNHLDIKILAKRLMFLLNLFEEISPQSIEDLILWATALERISQEFRKQAAELAKQEKSDSGTLLQNRLLFPTDPLP